MTDRLLAGEFLAQWLEMGATLESLRKELGDPNISQRVLLGKYFERQGEHDLAEVCFGARGRKANGVPTYSALLNMLKESDDGGSYRLSELLEDKNPAYGRWQRDKARLVENQMRSSAKSPSEAAFELERQSRKGGFRIDHSDFLQSYKREQKKKNK